MQFIAAHHVRLKIGLQKFALTIIVKRDKAAFVLHARIERRRVRCHEDAEGNCRHRQAFDEGGLAFEDGTIVVIETDNNSHITMMPDCTTLVTSAARSTKIFCRSRASARLSRFGARCR